jgi:hypothetical protein
MLRKDYIVRQFEEFGKFIALVFSLKKDDKHDEIGKLLNEAALKFTSAQLEEIENVSDEKLIQIISGDKFKDEQLKMLGDLLYEKGLNYTALIKPDESTNALRKALLIYNYIRSNALETDFSLDMHFKMKAIEQLLKEDEL